MGVRGGVRLDRRGRHRRTALVARIMLRVQLSKWEGNETGIVPHELRLGVSANKDRNTDFAPCPGAWGAGRLRPPERTPDNLGQSPLSCAGLL